MIYIYIFMATPNIEKIRQAKSYSNGESYESYMNHITLRSALQTMEPELSIGRRKNEMKIPEAMSAICTKRVTSPKNIKEPIN